MPKEKKSPAPIVETDKSSSTYGESDDTYYSTRSVSGSVSQEGFYPLPGDVTLFAFFNNHTVLDVKWLPESKTELEIFLPIDLKEPKDQLLITEKPMIFVLRAIGGKGKQDPDPLLHTDNKAGATVDLFPLLIGEDEIFIRLSLVFKDTGLPTGCFVIVHLITSEGVQETLTTFPFLITMVSAHCLPPAKDGTFYTAAISLDNVTEHSAVKFGLSLSTADAQKCVWATASNAGFAGDTTLNTLNDDKFVPEDLILGNTVNCRSYYWNAMNRRLVDPYLLRKRLSRPLLLEMAGIPRAGKIDVRGRYMALVDAGALLQPGVVSLSVCSRVLFYNEIKLPENIGGLLDLPPVSGKQSARETDLITDEFEHNTYIVIKFDLWEALVPKVKLAPLFDTLGLKAPEGPAGPIDLLDPEPPPDDPTIDVRKIRKEGGALAVHKELSGLACRGAVPMNQGIKRTAANRLLMRVRSMLKQFPPGDCSYVEWQDTVTSHHAASRRAVSSSFAPQPPPHRIPPRVASARARMAGDIKVAKKNAKILDKISKTPNPRSLICKTLRSLEANFDREALELIEESLLACPRNRFLLWMYGGQQFDKGSELNIKAAAAIRISVKGDISDGIANVIGWAALHTIYHFNEEPYPAFTAARKMRKSYELPSEWNRFYQRWIEESGQEEVFWIPTVVSSQNPFLVTAAFFLCLRCYKFTEMILTCVEKGCASIGSRLGLKTTMCSDVYYIRAASLILRRRYDAALQVTEDAIKKMGPSPMMSQMRTTCLSCIRGWDGVCQVALDGTEKAGAQVSPALLLKAAVGGMNSNPEAALQRAARAHKAAPCGHSALVIARIYAKIGEMVLAERWAAAAVKYEPLLADGWAVLALLAIYNKKLDKAKAMIRTSKQVGDLSPDIEEEVTSVMDIVKLEGLSDSLVKDLCLCEYY